jgi:hypothetical protein
MRSLWSLLPTSTRCRLWPATFAFSNALGFDAVVTPHATAEEYEGYLMEEQAAEYPEGRYELHLQMAAEAGDQRELDVLFARRSRAETWRMGWILLGIIFVLVAGGNWLVPDPPPPPPATQVKPKADGGKAKAEHARPPPAQ